jgi:5-methyltetrahydropteroyltriglutamate--homocysteine methyltransferase
MRRIDEAAKFIPVGQLAISPQCGFASGVGLAIPPDVQWAKLQVLLRVAERVWG